MKRMVCISSDDDDDGSMPSWAGKNNNTKLVTLMEKLIDSVLLINDKMEGLSNRVDALEGKLNEEIILGRKERTEFMNEVKSELAKLKKSQEAEQTVLVGSHLVSKLSNLQKSVVNEIPVDIAHSSEGWDQRPWDTCLDVQQPNHENRDSKCQQRNQVDNLSNLPQPKRRKPVENKRLVDIASGSEGWRTSTSHLDVQQPNGWEYLNLQQPNPRDCWAWGSWDDRSNVQQLNQVDNLWNLPQSKRRKPVENKRLVDTASGGEGWRTSTSHLDVQQPNGWDKHLNLQQPNRGDCWGSWDDRSNVQQKLNQVDNMWNLPQPKGRKPVENKRLVDIASGGEGWRTSTSHLDVQQPNGWDKHLNLQQPKRRDCWGSWDDRSNVQQLNQVDNLWNLLQPKRRKPVENKLLDGRKTVDTVEDQEKNISHGKEDDSEEDKENENMLPDASEEEVAEHSQSKHRDNGLEEESEEPKQGSVKPSAKKEASRTSELKNTPAPKIATTVSFPKIHSSHSTSKHSKESSHVRTPVASSRKEKDLETSKRKRSTRSKSATNVTTSKEKAGKKLVKGKGEQSKGLNPSEEELRYTIAQLLCEVDMNTLSPDML